ncbi:hypothetical protein L195_g061178, partial [Trifolium pratense]
MLKLALTYSYSLNHIRSCFSSYGVVKFAIHEALSSPHPAIIILGCDPNEMREDSREVGQKG